MRCPHCGYEWDYKGKRKKTLCPNCYKLVDVTKTISERGGVIDIPKDINMTEILRKAGATIVEASQDDKVVIVDIPDDKVDELLPKFNEALRKAGGDQR